ncbi:MAG TPA: glycosyltransferase [Lactovum miscens]|uniref:glycosyltransferase n=1 Tax=Lactovum miscens TaxID=190387 RepID=UPI002ED84F5B
MKKVVVIMSTYNGEKYIREQIDSILDQDYTNFYLSIRDDGSLDKTNKILNEYISNNAQVKVEFGENQGYCKSFFDLLRKEEADYYALADQDDIWLVDKLSTAISDLQNHETENLPLLWFSNLDLYDGEMNYLGTPNPDKRNYDLASSLFTCIGPGMSYVINREARDRIITYSTDTIHEHDFWISRVVEATGKVIYNPKSFIKYRRHNSNASQYSRNTSERIKLGLKRLITSDIYKNTKEENLLLEERYRHQMNEKNLKILSMYNDHNFIGRLKKVLTKDKLKDNLKNEIIFRLILLLNIL